jgi:pimeloyl-ACP methyl ester carboxylesterase
MIIIIQIPSRIRSKSLVSAAFLPIWGKQFVLSVFPIHVFFQTEDFYINSLEEWRKKMNLDKFILLGHSMGGFVVSRYATLFPNRVAHLILVEAWGLHKPHEGIDWTKPMPFWIKSVYMTKMNPLRIVRALGPLGPAVNRMGLYYAWARYSSFLLEESPAMADYLFHGNVIGQSGEEAFQALTFDLFWAKNPALDDLVKIDPALPISFMYGAQSYFDTSAYELCKTARPGSSVSLDVVDRSSHDIFADNPIRFNEIVARICNTVSKV